MADIDKSLDSITKGIDKKNDALMMMSPECNWGQFLTPAPFAIAILGDLLLISTDTDFSLEENSPAAGFKLLNYPSSFRACLVQVTNEGWTAFNTAHTNMDQIRLQCSNVDGHVKNAVTFLLQGTPIEVEKILPMSLSKIQKVADDCLLLVSEVERGFVGLMSLIAELLEASTNTKGVFEKKRKETETAIQIATTHKARLEDDVEDSKKRLTTLNAEVADAQTEFKEAINSIPSGGELLGLMAGEALVDGIRTIITVGTQLLSKCSIDKSQGGTSQPSTSSVSQTEPSAENTDELLSKQNVYKQVGFIYRYICILDSLSTGKIDENSKPSPDWTRIASEGTYVIKSLQATLSDVDVEKNSGQLRMRVSLICDEAISVCTELKNISKNLTVSNDDSKVVNLVSRVNSLKIKAQTLDAEARKGLGTNPLDRKSPYLSQVPAQSTSTSVAQAAAENARYRTNLAKETLKDAKLRQEKSSDELGKSNEKITQVLIDMTKLNIEKVDFDSIRETLVKGINALAELREQWGKLVRFFQMVSNIIKVCLNTSLKEFVDQVKIGRDLKMGDLSVPLSNIFRDVIFEQASKSSQISFVVYTIADAYVQISNKHVMDQITALGRLIALDSTKDKQKIALERNKLFSGCQQAQNSIREIVMRAKDEFTANVDARIAKISEIEAKLPAIDPKKEQEIQDSVSKGFTGGNVDDLI